MPKKKIYKTTWIHVIFGPMGDVTVTINKYWWARGKQIQRSHFAIAYPYHRRSRIQPLMQAIDKSKAVVDRVLMQDGWSVQITTSRTIGLSNSPKVIRHQKFDDLGGD